MSSKSSFSKNCSFCCLFMIVVSAFVLLFAGLNYADSQNFVESQCVLTSVTYPTNTPSHNGSWSDFIECDCGRRCTSDLGTCIKLFAYEQNSPSLTENGEIQTHNSQMIKLHPTSLGGSSASSLCTFAETDCPNGESHDNRITAINDAITKAQPYKEKMLANETIPCFINDNEDGIYLEVDKSEVLLIVIASLTLLFMLCALGCCIEFYRESEKPCFVCGIKCSECKSKV